MMNSPKTVRKFNFGLLNTEHIFSATSDYSLIFEADIVHHKFVSGILESSLVLMVFTLHRPRDLRYWIARCGDTNRQISALLNEDKWWRFVCESRWGCTFGNHMKRKKQTNQETKKNMLTLKSVENRNEAV